MAQSLKFQETDVITDMQITYLTYRYGHICYNQQLVY